MRNRLRSRASIVCFSTHSALSQPWSSCTERPVFVGDGVPPTGDRTVDSSQVFSLLYYFQYETLFDFGLNMPFAQQSCVLFWEVVVRSPCRVTTAFTGSNRLPVQSVYRFTAFTCLPVHTVYLFTGSQRLPVYRFTAFTG
jgi:hypothetical protein